ncbi:MAG: metallophosphoesterase [Desulfobacterales bacterium]|nr:MAG: metallophosphoesterase [Desulfobacterales bacterium]
MHTMTRRDFLGTLAAGLALVAGGCSKKLIWPARGSDKGSLRLVFYTDVHARTEWETPVAMARAARTINAQKADLVIAGGDLITDGFQSSAARVAARWEAYRRMHRAIQSDIYPVIGNQDLVAANPEDGTPAAKDPRAVYLAQMGLERTYYAFDAVGYHFVMLDSIQVTGDEYQYQGLIAPGELEWLRQDLASVPGGTPIVLATHIPLLSAFYGATQGMTFAPQKNRVVVNNRDVLNLMENHNVILVLQGHLHAKELIRWRNTAFIVGGAICGRWWRGPWYGTEEGFNVITLTGNHVGWEYLDYGWEAGRPPNA